MQPSTLNTTVPFRKGQQTLEREAAFLPDQLVAPAGTVTDAIVMEITCNVKATGTPAALTKAEQLKVLAGFSVTFKQGLGDVVSPLEPFQATPLDKLRLDALRILEQDVEGLEDTVTGLQKAWATGSNTVTFRAYLPCGHLAKIAESIFFTGLSPEQLLDCELSLVKAADPFASVNAALELTSCKVVFSPGTKKGEARRIGFMPHARRVVNAEQDFIKTPEGLVLELSDEGALLTTALRAITVRAGGVTVTDDPSTPAKVYADFLRKYPKVGDAEKSITEHRTPVYVLAPTALTRAYSGAVEAKQKDKQKEWQGRALYIPLPSHAEVMALVEQFAKRLEPGRAMLAVSTAMYEKLEVDDRLLPYAGMTIILDNEDGFAEFSGIYCGRNGSAYVTVPEHRQRACAHKIQDAMRSTPTFPSGNRALVDSIILDECRWVPGAVTHPSGLAVMSKVRQDVTALIREAAVSLNPALRSAF